MALLTLALVLASCSSGSGASQAKRSASPSAPAYERVVLTGPNARTALGDLRSLDPCSLVRLASYAALGPATFGDPQSMDYCVVEVPAAAGTQEVHVGEIDNAVQTSTADLAVTPTAGAPSREATSTLPGGQELWLGRPGGPTCRDEVVFADRLGIRAEASAPDGGAATPATCEAAADAVDGLVAQLAAHRVTHRTFPARSWGPIDPCDVLMPSAVAKVLPALAAVRPVGHPAQHQCEFGAGAKTPKVALVLGAAYQRFDGGPDSTTTRVHGHQVVAVPRQPDDRAGECVGYGPHVAFPSRSGQPAMEMAELHVALPAGGSTSQACADVRALATGVFARLP